MIIGPLAFALAATSGFTAAVSGAWSAAMFRASGLQPGWTDVSNAVRPPAMAGAMMEYSPRDQRFVLFGGWDGSRGLDGTWVFDPANRTWTELHPAVSPIERGDEMLVYDDQADVFVLFGGWHEFSNQTYARLSDTWTFSLATMNWTERHPTVSPSPRSDPQVAYDSVVDVTLLIGGFDGTSYLGDVWSYSLANDSWTARPSSLQPSPRADGRLVYVRGQNRFILFGGNDYNGPNFTYHHLADTWSYSWNSNAWTPLHGSVAPSARDYPVFAVATDDGYALLTSGYGDRVPLNDVWGFRLADNVWVNLTPLQSPPHRYAASGGFDSVNHIFVLFGGVGIGGLLADTWYFVYEPSSASPTGVGAITILGLVAIALVVTTSGLVLIKRHSRKARSGPTRDRDTQSMTSRKH